MRGLSQGDAVLALLDMPREVTLQLQEIGLMRGRSSEKGVPKPKASSLSLCKKLGKDVRRDCQLYFHRHRDTKQMAR